jgi:hypothetical protein
MKFYFCSLKRVDILDFMRAERSCRIWIRLKNILIANMLKNELFMILYCKTGSVTCCLVDEILDCFFSCNITFPFFLRYCIC